MFIFKKRNFNTNKIFLSNNVYSSKKTILDNLSNLEYKKIDETDQIIIYENRILYLIEIKSGTLLSKLDDNIFAFNKYLNIPYTYNTQVNLSPSKGGTWGECFGTLSISRNSFRIYPGVANRYTANTFVIVPKK